MANRYIVPSQEGWLRVRLEPGGIVALPEYLKVFFTGRANNRDYFEISEGVYAGKKASVAANGSGSYLGAPLPTYLGPVSLSFKRRSEKIATPIGELNAITSPDNPIPDGVHPVQLPDFPHEVGRGYLGDTNRAMTWFYMGVGHAIDDQGDRYLHPGSGTLGCVTVTDLSRWTQLYAILIKSRAQGGKNIGLIRVSND